MHTQTTSTPCQFATRHLGHRRHVGCTALVAVALVLGLVPKTTPRASAQSRWRSNSYNRGNYNRGNYNRGNYNRNNYNRNNYNRGNNGFGSNWFRVERQFDDRNEEYRNKVRVNPVAIISDIVRASESRRSNPPPRSNPRPVVRPQPRPYVSPVRPVVSRPIVKPKPVVKPRANVLPPKPTSLSLLSNDRINAMTGTTAARSRPLMASRQQLEDARGRVDEQLVGKTDELEELAARDVENLATDASSAINDPADRQAFVDAARDGDTQTMRDLAQKHGLDPRRVDAISQAIATEDAAIRLGDAARDGASAAEIDQLAEELVRSHETSGGFSSIGPSQLDGLVNDVSVGAHARDAINNSLSSSTTADFPSGNCDVYTVPGLPEGCVATTADGQLIQGGDSLGFEADVDTQDALGIAVPADEPLSDTSTDAAQLESGVLLRNPRGSGATINYTVDGTAFTMTEGQSQTLGSGKRRTIVFDRGGDYGEAKYSLVDGTFTFRVSEKGWELYKQTFTVTLSNARHLNPFHYVFMNKEQSIPSGGEKTHTSDYPILIAFARGDDGPPARKQLTSGTYAVALDREKNRLDLFDESAMTALAATSSAPRTENLSRSSTNRPRGATPRASAAVSRSRRSRRARAAGAATSAASAAKSEQWTVLD